MKCQEVSDEVAAKYRSGAISGISDAEDDIWSTYKLSWLDGAKADIWTDTLW
jgi:NADPH-dependent 7-cyano-7-deazaguanine reductase QueF-like protein